MWKFLYIIFPVLVATTSSAQQLSFEEIVYKKNAYSCSGFESYFRSDPSVSVWIKNPAFYKSKKVKIIHIYSDDNKLQKFFEFDSTGNFLRFGDNIQTCFKVGWSSGENPHYNAVSYYKDSLLIRTDTFISKYFKYNSGDTLMSFSRQESKIYKSGALLNQQNRYYNENYYRKRIRVNRQPDLVIVNRFGMRIRGKRIYLKKKIRSDFDSLNLYFAKETSIENGFYAHAADKAIDKEMLKEHSFHKLYQPLQKNISHAAGESFHEPIYCGYDYTCDHIYVDNNPPSFERKEFTLNANGLYDEYISLYFPQDTNKISIQKYKQRVAEEQEKYKGKEGYSFSNEFSYLYPRLETPVKQRLYYMRYTYF